MLWRKIRPVETGDSGVGVQAKIVRTGKAKTQSS